IYLNGWVHRDVSVSNILLLVSPEVRRCLTSERRQQLGECIAMLIDEDQGIKEETLFDTTRKASGSRTGTIPFMSMRLLECRVYQRHTITTAIDDLESFNWVLCFTVFEI
ncbi:hypothetical protein ARMGADRAFT_879797, partial [Armillaria gallica]